MTDDLHADANTTSDFESPSAPVTALVANAPLADRPVPSVTLRDGLLRDLVHTALDSLDLLGDRIAGAVGLR